MKKLDIVLPDEYVKYQSSDPFPDIPPALLNSADVHDYVLATGMIRPFNPDKLKSGSYEIPVSGEVHLWDDNRKKTVRKLEKVGDEFALLPNSIAFVFLATEVFLPDYIALRFNLKIEHVHKGLLLGTGPLVDPGFAGSLFVPLHNLTVNEYRFTYGQGLIWVEFTKLSPNSRWTQSTNAMERIGKYVPFREDKRGMKPADYIAQATQGDAVVSSIPDAVDESRKAAKEAQRLVAWFAGIGIVTVVALFIQFYPLYLQGLSVIQDSMSYTSGVRKETGDRVQALEREVEKLRAELKSFKKTELPHKRKEVGQINKTE